MTTHVSCDLRGASLLALPFAVSAEDDQRRACGIRPLHVNRLPAGHATETLIFPVGRIPLAQTWMGNLRRGKRKPFSRQRDSGFQESGSAAVRSQSRETRGSLRKTPEAMQQGPGRIQRGEYFFQAAQDAAGKMNTPLNWKLEAVPGVGHEYRQMADAAAEYLYGVE